MQRFKNILVVIDEKAENRVVVERAVILAQRNRARLTIVNVIKELPHLAPLPEVREPPVEIEIIEDWPPDRESSARPEPPAAPSEGPSPAEVPGSEPAVVIRERITEEESQLLERWVDFVRQSKVPVQGKVLYGRPFVEIIREVLRNGHDLVMICAEGQSGLKERLFGGTSMHLMRKCPCPVWVIKPGQPRWHNPILAAVDPDPVHEERQALNIKILDLATSLARRQESELIVVHTWTFPAEHLLTSGQVGPSSEVNRWVRETQDQHRRWLAEILQPYALQDLKHQVYLLKGEPGHLIPELAAKKEVELIVMGTVSRTGVAGLFIGNTAERILSRVDCSVLTVKPDGFVSPVKLDE